MFKVKKQIKEINKKKIPKRQMEKKVFQKNLTFPILSAK